ncbi:D-site 20S pre-rRNA nuclease [Tothia fuscella]|uniref:20S-pre-rRNA D-site endonuclease NOB1 n=1 Tax=Tothia fuscella TaxID=1048955 RepID=A0A9P4P4A1_9PEZI|nr:D-site 20S pre-rRNA nuclease [Tothia fuscella]
MATRKPVHTIVLDAGPIIRGEPSISSLLQQCEQVVSTPAVISEIRDEATRSRLTTSLLPFLTLRNPKPDSVKTITEFSRKTGDLAVLSRVDIQLLALSYEIECERNGGNWRLRSTLGQKRTNGPPPKVEEEKNEADEVSTGEQTISSTAEGSGADTVHEPRISESQSDTNAEVTATDASTLHVKSPTPEESTTEEPASERPARSWSSVAIEISSTAPTYPAEHPPSAEPLRAPEQPETEPTSVDDLTQQLENAQISEPSEEEAGSDGSDSEGWITPANLKKQQAKDAASATAAVPEPKSIQVATITGDFAMQNVLLQMNLNLLSTSLHRVRHIKTFVLRCHACFNVVRDMTKQFCPRCGKPTLTRVSCSTNQNGDFTMHLKKNMQWNKRGDKYSIPKPVAGASNRKVRGGGKDSWGAGLILAEDQKEFTKAVTEEKRAKYRDLMDEDYLPGILTGDRMRAGGKPKVGAGRNVNSKKR